jgi:hypothetical protein
MARTQGSAGRRKTLRLVLAISMPAMLTYAFAYLGLVRPVYLGSYSGSTVFGFGNPRQARYAYDHQFLNWFFSPANWIDRQLRSDLWTDYRCSDRFIPAIKTAIRAVHSPDPHFVQRGAYLRDLVDQTEVYDPQSDKWRTFDTMVWQEEAALRSAPNKK